MKWANDLVQYGEEWDQEHKGSALWPVMWKTTDSLASKGTLDNSKVSVNISSSVNQSTMSKKESDIYVSLGILVLTYLIIHRTFSMISFLGLNSIFTFLKREKHKMLTF